MEFEVSIEELKGYLETASHNGKPLLRGLIAIVERQDHLIQLAEGGAKTPKSRKTVED